MSNPLLRFSRNTFKNYGAGNPKLLLPLLIFTGASLFALIGFFSPLLLANLSILLPILVTAGVFIAVAAIVPNAQGMIFGLVIGALAGMATQALSSVVISIAPVGLIALAIPNVIAGAAYLLGKIGETLGECFSFKKKAHTDDQALQPFRSPYSAPAFQKQAPSSGTSSHPSRREEPRHVRSIYHISRPAYQGDYEENSALSLPVLMGQKGI